MRKNRIVAIAALAGAATLGAAFSALPASADTSVNADSGRSAVAQARMADRFGKLSDEQKSCLQSQGLTRPEAKPTQEQRQALHDAAANCGIEVPGHAGQRPQI